ncbi:hypothetical protein [Candidatus Venteria ishoeyi]|uniref:Uncharacterized protein n=1 Tax=Candidatus Venteria ishoeyi TaxID=1899563 RepID=A0A1H6FIZ3_9GAMM|nr:hypothetical protein [Candidatus Venteria ishoeyi]SEH09015.1 Uncharacterised protein [Candidatus Venteria ishoeyi]
MARPKYYPVELTEYEIGLILKYVLAISPLLKRRLKNPKPGTYDPELLRASMSLAEITDVIGWLAGEANHTRSRNLEFDLNGLCESLECVESDIKHGHL